MDSTAQSMRSVVDSAIKSASWLTPADEATVELLRRLADRMDEPGFPVVDGKFDNVSESLFLKAAASLGLTPQVRSEWEKKEKKTGGGRLETLRKGTANLRAA